MEVKSKQVKHVQNWSIEIVPSIRQKERKWQDQLHCPGVNPSLKSKVKNIKSVAMYLYVIGCCQYE